MKFARILVAFAATVAALLVAPTSNAAQAEPRPDEWIFQSDAVPNDVWDQTNWAWDPMYPIIAHPRHGKANQRWIEPGDGTIRNVQDGSCVTAINNTLAGRQCDGSSSQQWKRYGRQDWRVWEFRLADTNRCVTHNGTYAPLILTQCEPWRVDQQWHMILV